MGTIGLIAAMPLESNALLRKVRRYKRYQISQFRGAKFRISDHDCLLITSGMGSKRAFEATQRLIDLDHPAYLISFGIAGAVRADLQIGDVVMATQNCILEANSPVKYQPLAVLQDSTRGIIEKALDARQVHLYLGTAITTGGEQSILDSTTLMYPILEMETAGIAQATGAVGIPLMVLRSISDGPWAPIPFNPASVMDEENNLLPGRLMLECFRRPRILFQFGGMIRNSLRAAENAALAVLETLGHPDWLN